MAWNIKNIRIRELVLCQPAINSIQARFCVAVPKWLAVG